MSELRCQFPLHDGNHGPHCFTAPEDTIELRECGYCHQPIKFLDNNWRADGDHKCHENLVPGAHVPRALDQPS
jgi:hypothetical protein